MIYIVKQGENQNYETGITAVIFTLFLTVARSVQSLYHFRQTESSFFSSLAEFSQSIAWTNTNFTVLVAGRVLVNIPLG